MNNAYCVMKLQTRPAIFNYRDMMFVFSAQMYGAGKTRLGVEFVNKVCWLLDNDKDVFKRFCPPALCDVCDDLLKIVSVFRKAKTVRVSAHGLKSYNSILEKLYYSKLTCFIEDTCGIAGTPVLFHFDEIGEFNVDELRSLRDECMSTWQTIVTAANPCVGKFPFFFFSGRGVAYNELGSF